MTSDNTAGQGRPTGGKPRSGRPSGKPGSRPDGRTGGKPGSKPTGKPSGKPGSKPAGKPSGKPGSKPTGKPGGKPRPERGARDERRPPSGPRDPHIPDDVTMAELDPSVANELRTLPEGLAEIVGRHLVAADRALVDGDVDLARAHVAAAKRRAGRVAAVRAAAGITAYQAGEWAEAVAELRTVRRMTGSDAWVPMIADCERGLQRPQRALEIIKEVDARKADPETRVELMLVASGARADLGQLDAAMLLLQVPELTSLPKGAARARMQYAYSELLERAGRDAEAREWMQKAAESDVDGVTDAAERVEETAGESFFEEEFGPDE